MSKYKFPNFTDSNILYKGKRYVAIETSGTDSLNNNEKCVQFIVWDGLHDAEVASGATTANGDFVGALSFSHVEIEVRVSKTIQEFVKNSAKAQERYFKDCGT